MSEENVEIVRKCLDVHNAFMRGELSREAAVEATAQFVDPQLEHVWHAEQTMPDVPQHLRGVPEFLRFWEQLTGAWTEMRIEPLEFIEASDGRVVTPCRQSGRGRESGIPIVFHSFLVWTIRQGRLRKTELFRHRAEALEAAGLRE
jgi:ketosteroid isomerase-like protein